MIGGFEPMEGPAPTPKEILKAFLEEDAYCVGCVYADKAEAMRFANNFRNSIRYHEMPIKISRQGSTVMLLKED